MLVEICVGVIVVLVVLVVFLAAKVAAARHQLADAKRALGLNLRLAAARPREKPLRERPRDARAQRRPQTYRTEIAQLCARAFELGDFKGSDPIEKACKQALAGGKHTRGAILTEISWLCAQNAIDPAETALAIEYLHAASLVVDDSPTFDNDSQRRGSPTVHATVGPQLAQMASVKLVGNAIQGIGRQVDWLRRNASNVVNADRIGARLHSEIGRTLELAAEGQHADYEELQPGSPAILDAIRKKTASFFEFATVAGWLIGGGSNSKAAIADARAIGTHLGLAYQIADDIRDAADDAKKKRVNLANAIGVNAARDEVKRNLEACRMLLEHRLLWSDFWSELLRDIWGSSAADPAPESAADPAPESAADPAPESAADPAPESAAMGSDAAAPSSPASSRSAAQSSPASS